MEKNKDFVPSVGIFLAIALFIALVGVLFNVVNLLLGGEGALYACPLLISMFSFLGLFFSKAKAFFVLTTIVCTLAWGIFLLISGWGECVVFEPELGCGMYGYDEITGWKSWWPYLLPLLTVVTGSLFVSEK